MKVYLLLTDDGRHLFYSDGPEVSQGGLPPSRGLRGWFERKSAHLKSAWKSPQHGLTTKARRVWGWLQRRTYADESLLVRLRTARAIEVHHPESLLEEEVRALWAAYLTGRQRRHLPWLGVNALISPLTIVLAPLPGPNIIGYWFAYRAVRHLLAILGLRRVQGAQVSVLFQPDRALDRPVGEKPGGAARVVARGGDPEELDEFLKRNGVLPEGEAAAEVVDGAG